VKATKLILAALVLFLAGMAAGAAVAELRWKARAKAELSQRELALSPMWYRMEFLRRAQRDLALTPEQQTRIEGYLREGQQRFRKLWEPVAPQARTEFEVIRERIRAELDESQRERFDKMVRERSRRADSRDRKTGDETHRPPRSGNSGPGPVAPK